MTDNTPTTDAPAKPLWGIVVTTKYIGASNTRGARIKAESAFATGGLTRPYDHELDVTGNHIEAARALATQRGWNGRMAWGEAPSGKGYTFIFAIE